jgi:hypothetical protein
MVPDAPAPTTAVICVALLTTKEVAATPPKLTEDALLNPVPLIITLFPVPAFVGEKEVITGEAFESINRVEFNAPVYFVKVTVVAVLEIDPTD